MARKAEGVGGREAQQLQQQQHLLSFQDDWSSSEAAPGACTFRAKQYFESLETSLLGRVLLTAGTVGSTQEVVQENVSRLPDGLVLVADKQAGGRGRSGNRWESPDGCLMFSTCKRLDITGQRLPFLQYIVSLAVVQAAQQEAARMLAAVGASGASARSIHGSSGNGSGGQDTSSSGGSSSRPNDIYAGSLKLGGILCHSAYRDRLFYVTMGVGLNVANCQPTTCLDALLEAAARSRGLPAPPPIPREALLARILSQLEPMLDRLCREGFAPFEADYYSTWLHSGQRVQLQEDGRQVGVCIEGLSQHGYLLASDEAGERYELHPDGQSLDFFQGLIKKKV